jgi:DNA-binding NarL/FixJ family response regulator
VTPARARLILADDHRLVAEGLRALLIRNFDVVAVVHEASELLWRLADTDADCLLLDLDLKGRNGLDLMPDIRAMRPLLRVLVVTMHLDRILADAVLHAGAQGFVPKDAGIDELEGAIREVLAGRRYLSPRVPRITYRLGMGAEHAGLARLTARQQEIMRLIGAGRSTVEIAAQLGLSTGTINYHRANIRRALGVASAAGLRRYAVLLEMGPRAAPGGAR